MNTSLAWTIPLALTPAGRDLLTRWLDPTFTDEDSPRTGMHFAPDVRILISPEPDSFSLAAHWVSDPFSSEETPSAFVVEHVSKALTELTGQRAPSPRLLVRTPSRD